MLICIGIDAWSGKWFLLLWEISLEIVDFEIDNTVLGALGMRRIAPF